MIWNMDLDDFSGKFCEAGKYPLLKAMNKALRAYEKFDVLAIEVDVNYMTCLYIKRANYFNIIINTVQFSKVLPRQARNAINNIHISRICLFIKLV